MDISIIVPLYKGKKYIQHIIDMVMENQKVLKENGNIIDIEIIFVNDFPDEDINNFFSEKKRNILVRLYKNVHNLGIHESRLVGLSKAEGIYVTFLDQDDEISSTYLYNQFNYIEDSDAVLCNGIYRENKLIYKNIEQQQKTATKEGFLKQGNYIVSPGQVMIKKSSISKKWKENILKENGSDDALLWILMLCEGKRFALNPNCEYMHKEEGANASLEFRKMRKSSQEILKVIKERKLLDDNDFQIYEVLLEERVKKHSKYDELLKNWDIILQNILSLLMLKEYKKFAIYGYGVIGKKLLHDLENRNIEPDFIVDKAASNFVNSRYMIYEPGDILESVDLILLTPLFAEEEIKKSMDSYHLKVISLRELL